MSQRKLNQQEAYRAYLNKWGLSHYVFAVSRHDKGRELYVLTHDAFGGKRSDFNVIRSVDTLIKAAKRVDTIKFYTGRIEPHTGKYGEYSDLYRYFDSWDEFREYCMVLKLSGL